MTAIIILTIYVIYMYVVMNLLSLICFGSTDTKHNINQEGSKSLDMKVLDYNNGC